MPVVNGSLEASWQERQLPEGHHSSAHLAALVDDVDVDVDVDMFPREI